MTDQDRRHWHRVARQWISWAGTPGHDAFWAYLPALRDFIGPGQDEVLEIGCGEGRVARTLTALGYRVTATDAVPAMVAAAAAARSAERHLVADAAALPFAAASFDRVMAYNVLMDVADMAAVLREVRRVLRPSGQLIASIVHPFRDRGRFAGPEPEADFVLKGSYFGRVRFDGIEERDGKEMHFAGWSQPLESYAAALEQAGLAIASLREPLPDLAVAPRLVQSARVPMFLWLKARPV